MTRDEALINTALKMARLGLIAAVQKEISDHCFSEFDDDQTKGVAQGLNRALTIIKGMKA